MRIADSTFTAIDFESAGARPGSTDVPVQIGLVTMVGTEIHRESLFCSYLRSDLPITWSARKVHGITDADIADAPSFADLWPEVRTALSDRVVVAHGSGTEKRFLRAFPFHGFGPWADTLKIGQAAWPDAPRHSLEVLVQVSGMQKSVDAICPDRRWHDALYDAVASLVLLKHVIETCDLAELPVDVLLNPDRSPYFAQRARR